MIDIKSNGNVRKMFYIDLNNLMNYFYSAVN